MRGFERKDWDATSRSLLLSSLMLLPLSLLPVTFDSVSLGDADDVDHLVLGKNVLDRDCFLHQTAGEIHLLRDRPPVQLNFVDVGLFLTLSEQFDLEEEAEAEEGKEEGEWRKKG